MAKFKWTYHQEDSLSQKNGEKLWYLDLGFDPGYEMEIIKTDDEPYVVQCYKGPRESMPKLVKKKQFKTLEDAKIFGIKWLITGLHGNFEHLRSMIEDLSQEALTEQTKQANKPEKKRFESYGTKKR